MPDLLVDADTLNTFKSRLDKHCLDQDVLCSFYSELTGAGGASIYCDVVKDTGKKEYLALLFSLDWIGCLSNLSRRH